MSLSPVSVRGVTDFFMGGGFDASV